MSLRQRTVVLSVLFFALVLLATVFLWNVLATVFFTITVAYVLYPLSEWFVDRGAGKRLSAAVTTAIAFVAGSLIAVPLIAVLYLRRLELVTFLRQLPAEITITVGETEFTIIARPALAGLRNALTDFAVGLAAETPILALKVVLFTILVYALLWQPTAPQRAVYGIVPASYHDVVTRFHQRLRSTLYAIYVLQAATAFGTFLVAWAVFGLLGYQGAFALAVVAGVFQFVPVVGPSIVVLALAAADLASGDVTGAVVVTALGLTLVGFLPDAVIRPRLARYTTGLPSSLYFVGFTGGVLSLGLVGFIAGPVVVALVVESGTLLVAERPPADGTS